MNPAQAVTLRVAHVAPLGPHVFRIGLEAGGGMVPRYQAGQYLKLVMPDGALKPLSIASAPESGVIELQVQATPPHIEVERSVAHHLRHNKTVECQMPYGRCCLPGDQRPIIMIAGGTGIAQMRAMLASSIAQQESRAIWIYWGVTSESGLFLDTELAAIAGAHPRVRYRPVVERPKSSWLGLTGLPHIQALRERRSFEESAIYCSGSPQMVKTVYQELLAEGMSPGQFHCDWLDIMRARNELL